ncbi:hypothetical protein [Pantanalinema sp. GBBB05]|uniref:hypothetical protein n=1 Tax=Pantanalinema sp. GBBB05 TaxID=2604139 RepID=UPI001E108755|nr:hypothetical protein [Pantanalinema sp. GBBB05]
MQIYAAIGDSDILPEIGEITYRLERVLTILKYQAVTRSRLHPAMQQATLNLDGWADTSFRLVSLIIRDALDSHAKEHATLMLRSVMQLCEQLEATVFDHLANL